MKDFKNSKSREEMIKIIDGMILQVVWIKMCIDTLEALKAIDKEKFSKSKNFIYITQSSLIYRYSMELVKLLNRTEKMSIYRILNLCKENSEMFDDSLSVVSYCKDVKKELDKYKDTITSLINRRKITYAHNDDEYYLFSQRAIDENPLNFDEIKQLAELLYAVAKTLQIKIDSPRKHQDYPIYSDDVKRLFGEKTEAEKFYEMFEER